MQLFNANRPQIETEIEKNSKTVQIFNVSCNVYSNTLASLKR